MNTRLDFYPEQARRFATTREHHARTRANIDRAVHDLRLSGVALATEHLVAGERDQALDVMHDLLDQQCKLAKIRHLQAVPS